MTKVKIALNDQEGREYHDMIKKVVDTLTTYAVYTLKVGCKFRSVEVDGPNALVRIPPTEWNNAIQSLQQTYGAEVRGPMAKIRVLIDTRNIEPRLQRLGFAGRVYARIAFVKD